MLFLRQNQTNKFMAHSVIIGVRVKLGRQHPWTYMLPLLVFLIIRFHYIFYNWYSVVALRNLFRKWDLKKKKLLLLLLCVFGGDTGHMNELNYMTILIFWNFFCQFQFLGGQIYFFNPKFKSSIYVLFKIVKCYRLASSIHVLVTRLGEFLE